MLGDTPPAVLEEREMTPKQKEDFIRDQSARMTLVDIMIQAQTDKDHDDVERDISELLDIVNNQISFLGLPEMETKMMLLLLLQTELKGWQSQMERQLEEDR